MADKKKMKIKKGDTVKVLTGKDRNSIGKVIAVYPETERVLVEGVNRVTRHTKAGQSARGARTGGLVVQEAAIHVSNVAVVDPDDKKARDPDQDPCRDRRAWRSHQDRPHPCRGALGQGPVRDMTETDTMTQPEVSAAVTPRLKQRYADEIKGALLTQFGYENVMQVPGVVKVVVNMGVGDAAKDAKLIEGAIKDLSAITGQKPLVTKARKSIAQFKLREGMPIGAHTTLRGDRMWEFLDRLVSVGLPRIRDFRGLSPKQFDGNGNYTFGLTEQSMFHEIDQDRIDRVRGMDITVVTTASNDDEGRALLKALGFPFKEN